ncbi:MAG: ArsR/SmtB family transcription factor [Fidelibacterota bacterium]
MDQFSQQALKVFKALADPIRYRIIQLLIERGELGCSDFAEHFDISAPAMSHHYRILENSDLVTTRKSGQHVFLNLNKEVLNKIVPGFEKIHVHQNILT